MCRCGRAEDAPLLSFWGHSQHGLKNGVERGRYAGSPRRDREGRVAVAEEGSPGSGCLSNHVLSPPRLPFHKGSTWPDHLESNQRLRSQLRPLGK